MGPSLLLSAAHYPVTVLGHGRRLGIWLQGCTIRCGGCVSRDTWEFDERRRTSVGALVAWARGACGERVDGVTISGGEPFDQPAALGLLVAELRGWLRELPSGDRVEGRDILCYSGYSWTRLLGRHAALVAGFDALVTGPYVRGIPGAPLRGSGNQEIHCVSALGRRRYEGGSADEFAKPRMQVFVDAGNRMWAIGIPGERLMEGVRVEMRQRGFDMEEVSWL